MRKNSICSWVISVGLVIVFVLAGCGSSPAASAPKAAASAQAAVENIPTVAAPESDFDTRRRGTAW